MAPLNLAIVGSGIFAREQHLPAIQALGDAVALKAIYSRTSASATRLAEGLNVDVYANDAGDGKALEDLLKRTDIDAVIIVLPITVQPAVIQQCLAAGKHVLSEKPIAPTIADARSLITSAPRTPLWAVAENFRFQSAWFHAAAAIRDLGRILTFRVNVANFTMKDNKYYNTAWRTVPDYQGGFLLDGGVHFVAALRVMVGDDHITGLGAMSVLNQEHLGPVDTIAAVCRLRSGAVGTIAVSFGTSGRGFDFEVCCEGGVVTVSGGGVVTVKGESTTYKDGTGVKEEIEAFAKGVQSGKLDPLQSPEEALKDLEVIEKILKSGEKGGEVVTLTGGLE